MERPCYATYSRLKPIMKPDNVRMIQPLQHVQLIIHHLLVASHILLENDLDGNFPNWTIRLTDDAIGSRTQRPPESIL